MGNMFCVYMTSRWIQGKHKYRNGHNLVRVTYFDANSGQFAYACRRHKALGNVITPQLPMRHTQVPMRREG